MDRTRFDLGNEKTTFSQFIPDVNYELIAGAGMTIAGGDVNPWVPYVGTGSVPEETTAGPEYDETDAVDGLNSVLWTGVGERSKLTKDLEADGDAWGFGIICRVPDTTLRCPISWSNDSNGNNSTVGIYLNNTGKVTVHHINDAGAEVQVNDTLTLGTGFHWIWVDKSATTLRLKVDGRSAQTAAVTGACTFTRLILGAQKIGSTHYYPYSGAIRHVYVLADNREATSDELTEMYRVAKIIAPGIP